MNNGELKISLDSVFPGTEAVMSNDSTTVEFPAEQLFIFMTMLKEKKEFQFDYLFCLTCVDWKDHLMMHYHLRSTNLHHELQVKCRIGNTVQPEIISVTDLWKGAELPEREVYDLFGVVFKAHPDLRRLFLDENWKGFPLRKNYVDENMIKL